MCAQCRSAYIDKHTHAYTHRDTDKNHKTTSGTLIKSHSTAQTQYYIYNNPHKNPSHLTLGGDTGAFPAIRLT